MQNKKQPSFLDKIIDFLVSPANIQKKAQNLPSAVIQQNTLATKKSPINCESILKLARIGAGHWNLTTNKVELDKNFYHIIGLSDLRQINEMSEVTKRIHPDDINNFNETVHRYAKKHVTDFECNFRLQHNSGHWIWILLRGEKSPSIIPTDKSDDLNITFFDVTNFKESELLSAEIQKIAQIGGWEYDVQNKKSIWTEQTYIIHQLPIGSDIKSIDPFSYYAKTEHTKLFMLMNECVAGMSFKDIFAFTDAAGVAKWVEVTGQPVHGADGKIYKIRGSIQDVTEKKLSDDRIQKRDAYIKALFNQSRDPIMTLAPPTWKFTSANKATLDLFQIKTVEEFIELGPWNLSPNNQPNGENSSQLAQRMISLAIENGSHFFEWTHIRRDGTPIPCTVLLSKVNIEDNIILQATVRDVTAERARAHELSEVMSALENSAIVAMTDTTGKILSVNDEFCKISGYNKNELIGKDHRIINSGLESKALFKDLWMTILSGKTWSGVMRNRNKSGHIYTVKTVIAPVRSFRGNIERFISINFDITEAKRVQEENEFILDTLGIGIWKYNPTTQELHWDKSLYNLYEIKPEDFSGHYQAWESLLTDSAKKLAVTELEKALSGEKEFNATFDIKTQSNTIKHIGGRGKVIRNKALEPIMMYGINWDKTKEVEMENALQLERAKALHNSKLATIGEMSAGIAHEINNPLAVINASIELLHRYKDDAEKHASKIDLIKKSVGRIVKIVNGLRKFSRVTDGKQIESQPLDRIIQDAAVMIENKSKKAGVKLELNLEVEGYILCDAIEIEQVIVNLISNGIDAAKTQTEKFVKVTLSEDEHHLIVRVLDSGSGISPDLENKLFQPFYTTKAVGEGTGLGLSIAKEILDQHKASIRINRDFPNTCFEVVFNKHTIN